MESSIIAPKLKNPCIITWDEIESSCKLLKDINSTHPLWETIQKIKVFVERGMYSAACIESVIIDDDEFTETLLAPLECYEMLTPFKTYNNATLLAIKNKKKNMIEFFLERGISNTNRCIIEALKSNDEEIAFIVFNYSEFEPNYELLANAAYENGADRFYQYVVDCAAPEIKIKAKRIANEPQEPSKKLKRTTFNK